MANYTPLSDEDIMASPSQERTTPGYSPLSEEDIAASARVTIPEKPLEPQQQLSQIKKNVPLGIGDVAGTIGSLGQLFDIGREKAFEYGVAKPLEYFKLLPEGKTAEDVMRSNRELTQRFQKPAEREGYVNRIFGAPFPTATGVEAALKKTFPSLAEKPETPEEQQFGERIRFATGVAPGPGGMVATAGRGAAGYLGSMAGQEAQKLQEREPFFTPGSVSEKILEPAVSIIGTVAAQGIGSKLKNVTFPSKAAEAGVGNAIAADISSGAFNREAFEAAVSSGQPYRLADFFSDNSNLRRFLAEEAGKAGSTGKSFVDDFNAEIGNIAGSKVNARLPQAQDRMLSFLEGRYGSLNAGEVAESVAKNSATLRENIYGALNQLPEAAAISKRAFNPDTINNEFVQGSINRVMGMDVPKQWGIVKPQYTPEVPSQFLEYDATGRPVMSAAQPAQEVAGNLAFWDLVKRDMDLQIRKAEMAGTETYDTLRAEALKSARKGLVDDLDLAVDSYPIVRKQAGELFGKDNAPEAGMDFYRRMNSIDRADAVRELGQLPPETAQLFRTGWLGELGSEISKPNGLISASNKFVGDKNFQQNAKLVLGRDYDLVRGRIMAESAQALSRAIKPIEPTGFLKKAGIGSVVGGGAAGVLAGTAENLVNAFQQAMFLGPKELAPVLGGAVAATAITGAKELQSRRIADRAVKLMLSNEPADHVKLSRLLDADPVTANALFKLNTVMQATREGEEKPAQADGGRIERASGGRIGLHESEADRLIRMAEIAKKNIGKQTESILNAPDEHVVRALAVANRNLEG